MNLSSWRSLAHLLAALLLSSSSLKAQNERVRAGVNASKVRSSLVLSKDFGETWTPADHGLPPETQASFLEQKGHEIVLATDNAGVFLSEGNRRHWKSIGEGLPGKKVNALHVSGKTIYVGVYHEGCFASNDGGATWTPVNQGLADLSVQAICMTGEVLLLGTDSGLFRRESADDEWEATSIGAQVLSIDAGEGIVVAGSSLGTAVSKDAGAQWEWVRQEGAVHYTRLVGKRIVELLLDGDLYYSDDLGETWTSTNYAPRKGSYVYEAVAIGQYQVMSNNYGVHRSSDQGKSWKLVYPTEVMGFFDFLVIGDVLYGGTRAWDEYRKRR